MPSKDVWKFTPVSYRTSAFWGRCPALTQLQLISPSRASGTADHVRSLDDYLVELTKIGRCIEARYDSDPFRSYHLGFCVRFGLHEACIRILLDDCHCGICPRILVRRALLPDLHFHGHIVWLLRR